MQSCNRYILNVVNHLNFAYLDSRQFCSGNESLGRNAKPDKGRHKKLFFFYFRPKGGGVLGQYKKPLSENTQIFLTKGGVSPNPKGFYQKN